MIDSISPVSINKVPFKGDMPVQAEEVKEQKSSKSWMLWTGLAALAAGGVYLATRGKAGKEVVENTGKPAGQLKEMAIDAFKKAGNKFEKGRAKLANGESYTGSLTQTTKDGKTIIREYKDGMLGKVIKKDGENIVSSKSYTYDENGMLTKITNDNETNLFARPLFSAYIAKDDKVIRTPISETIKNIKNGRIQMQRIDGKGCKWFYYDDTGKLKYVKHDKFFGTDTIAYYPDGKSVKFVGNYNSGKFYDKKGNLTDDIWIDMARGGESYSYNGLNRSKSISPGCKSYSYVLDTSDDVSLSITKRPDYYSSNMHFRKNGKQYRISSGLGGKDVKIIERFNRQDKEILESTDKKLWDELIADSKKYAEEIKSKHKKALRLRNQLQLADMELSHMHWNP